MTVVKWLRHDHTSFMGEDDLGPMMFGPHHGFLHHPVGDKWSRLCLTVEGEYPDGIHILGDKRFCASCVRRSLEIFR